MSLLRRFWPRGPAQQLRLIGGLLMVAALFSLGFAFTAQYGFRLQPCILCLYQRVPYALIAALGAAAFFAAKSAPLASKIAVGMSIPAFLTGTAIGFFQVGVEQKWWRGTDECVGSDLTGLSPEQMIAKISAAPLVRCDEIQFEFLGISMAGYNALWSLGLAVFFIFLMCFSVRTHR